MKPELVFGFIERQLGIEGFPDYERAMNGLQLEGRGEIGHLGVAVDASEATIQAAAATGADLLLVHHGIFWDGPGPITGRCYRRLRPAIEAGLGIFAVHLPLDAHAELGNSVLLARGLGIAPQGSWGRYEGRELGWWGEVDCSRESLAADLESLTGEPVRLVPAGPEHLQRVGVITGGASAFLGEASERGLDTFVTGEAPHHAAIEAMELGINLVLGGHYATETFGVRALAERIEEELGISWTFIDRPTGF